MPRRLTKADIGKIYKIQQWLAKDDSPWEYARLVGVGMKQHSSGAGKSLMQTFRILGDGRLVDLRWANFREVSPESIIIDCRREVEWHTREAERHTRLRDEAIARNDLAIANANNLRELIALDEARSKESV